MTDFTREIGELTDHAGHIETLAGEIGQLSTTLSSTGVGTTEMYGIMVGQLAHPILQHVADSKSRAITDLGDVLASTADTLHTAVSTYSDTEQTAAQRSNAVETAIEQINVP